MHCAVDFALQWSCMKAGSLLVKNTQNGCFNILHKKKFLTHTTAAQCFHSEPLNVTALAETQATKTDL